MDRFTHLFDEREYDMAHHYHEDDDPGSAPVRAQPPVNTRPVEADRVLAHLPAEQVRHARAAAALDLSLPPGWGLRPTGRTGVRSAFDVVLTIEGPDRIHDLRLGTVSLDNLDGERWRVLGHPSLPAEEGPHLAMEEAVYVLIDAFLALFAEEG